MVAIAADEFFNANVLKSAYTRLRNLGLFPDSHKRFSVIEESDFGKILKVFEQFLGLV